MAYENPPITKVTDRFLGFCAVTPNKKFMRLFEIAGVKNVLISFHYIQKDPILTRDILQAVNERGGLFMTDSGAFSFLNDKSFDLASFDWLDYLDRYSSWLDDNKKYVFSACNLDVDLYVGHDIVLNWNEKFFRPLEDHMNIIYVAHPNVTGRGDLDAVNEYSKTHKYIAVNESMAKHVASIYQAAKLHKCCVHGLAWTKPTILNDFPFFSVDSSSWVNYQKYGATPVWDGKNFTQYDKDGKSVRRTLRKQCEKYGIKEYEFVNEKNETDGSHNDDEGLTYSLRTWLDVFESIKKVAKTKLSTTLEEQLKGKAMEFKQPKEETKVKKSGLSSLVESTGIEVSPATVPNYAVDEESGTQVAIYKKRDERIDIDLFENEVGGTMVCNFCHIQDKCPKFSDSANCAFNFSPDAYTESPISVIDMLIKAQTERVNRAMFFEKMEGGMPNKIFQQEIRLLNELNMQKVNILDRIRGGNLKITQTVEIEGAAPAEGGLASMIISALKK